jgi:hypothetical protein
MVIATEQNIACNVRGAQMLPDLIGARCWR